MKRKLLSVLLTLCLAFSLLPTAALADEGGVEGGQTTYVAQIDETKYETLQAAVDEADNKTVKLLEDVTESITIPAGKTVTLDLNGKTLVNSAIAQDKNVTDNFRKHTITNNGTLTILDSVGGGIVDNVSHGRAAIYNAGTIAEIKSGKFTSSADASVSSEDDGGNSWYVIYNAEGATISKISGGEFLATGKYSSLFCNSGTIDEISGGTFTQDGFIAFKNQGTVNKISGGTFASENESCIQNWGTISEVTGGTITAGSIGIWNFSSDRYSSVGKVGKISGGNISGSTAAIRLNDYDTTYLGTPSTTNKASVAVSGGNISGNLQINTHTEFSVTGGAFTDIANAVKYAADDATIKLAGDVTGSGIGASVTKKLTLDLNGHSIKRIKETSDSNAGYPALYVNGGDLTLIDTSAAKTGAVKSVITATTGASPYNAVSSAVYVNGGTFTLKSGALSTDVKNDKDQSQGVVVCQNSKFIMEDGSIIAESDSGNAFGVVAFTGSEFTLNNGTITSAGMGISGNGSSGEGNTTININGGSVTGQTTGIYQPQEGALNITAGEIKGGTGIEAKSGNVKIEITGTPTITATGEVKHTPSGNGNSTSGYAIAAVENNAYSGNANVSIANGFYNGEVKILKDNDVDAGKTATITITGGYFTSDPTAYLAAGKYVIKSDKAGYTYAVTGTEPEKTPIFVDENTTHDTSAITDGTTRSAIDAVINKAKVEGVAAAVDESALVASKVDASEVDAAKKVEVEVSVKVEVKSADLSGENAAKTLTFEAKPVATIKVDGNVRATNVAVPNSLLSGDITVKLPLPEGFTPEQIKHISSDRSVEYFLRTAKTGAKTFEIKDGCAVFTITKFSTFELSGTVTYVEPSYSSGSSYDPTYSVTVDKTKNGSVTVSPKNASKGDTVTVTVKPDSGYVLETLTVTDKNGNELTLKDKGNGKYTFTMPSGKVEVKATFMEDNSMLNFFYDVPNNAYFYEAVKWAVKNGITTGVGNDLFAPEQPCTRAQIVTFLWRAAGSPEPKGAASGMTDVVSGSYYEKAVAWAIENGITTGTTTSTFSPDATCTRAQAVTFLARALKAKAASAAEFSDVPTDSYFADAVAWAAANGVTEGIGGGLFGSDNDCTRGQIVTFLYRAYNK